MKKISLFAFLLSVPVIVMAQTAVFTDVFGSSTTNQASVPSGTPTVSATSYDIASSKAATGGANGPYCRPGNLRLSFNGATTSGFVEAQAIFAASPVSLVTVGDFINLTYTFTNTGGTLLAGSSTSYLLNGFFNSGGTIPLAGSLANSGLNATASSPYATGNCANWQGYVSRISNGGTSQAYTRPVQNGAGTTSANQDLVGNNSGGGTFINPSGIAFDLNETAPAVLASGATYTISYTIALTDLGALTVTNNLYSGVGTGGTLVFSQTNTAAGTTNITSAFDGFTIGVRHNTGSVNPTMDISRIAITKNISGSPGPSFTVTGGGTGCLGDAFLVGLSGSVSTNNYLLFTNGVFSGVTQAGTGSAINFAAQTVQAAAVTNTVLASNTVSSFTGLMSGSVVIQPYPAPVITTQPTTALVVTNGVAVFSVAATGVGLHYQWYKNGAALTDITPFAGSQTAALTVSPATPAEAALAANGYYVVITNNCGNAKISTTNALTLQPPGNLVWQGGNPNLNWDLASTLNFTNPASTFVVFNSGDNVTFDDSSANRVVTLVGNLAASSVTYNASQDTFLRGSGGLVGTGSLLANGSGTLTLSNVATFTYSGGSVISSGTVAIRNGGQQSLGTGPINLTGGTLEVGVASGSATSGLSNNINVTANSTLKWDGNGTYALVLLSSLTGSSSATLTLQNYLNNTATPDRVRLYGNFTNDSPVVINTAGNQIDLAAYAPSGNQVFNGLISGTGGRFITRAGGNLILNNGGSTFNDSGVSANGNGPSGYSVMFSGGNLGVGADSVSTTPPTIDSSPLGTGKLGINVGTEGGTATLFANGGAHTVGNEIIYTSATNTVNFVIGGSNNLTLSGAFGLHGADNTGGTNRNLQVNNTALTTFSGVVGDNGLICGLNKTGSGTLILSGVDTYTGPTTVGAGKLWVNGQLDIGGVTVTNGSLGGSGTILGAVSVGALGTLAPGTAALGTLTVNSNLSLAGNALFKLNKSLAPSNDVVSVSGALSASGSGTLTVTNLGTALVAGDSFKLFSKPVTGGSVLIIAGGGMNWTNKLAIDGSIQALSVFSSLATYPTNITASVSGSTLTITWPATHLGWILQSQTNTIGSGLQTNWVDVGGSASLTTTPININSANPTVFFRLRHP